MCGIVGYAGNQESSNILVEGLSHLEYRGYDSSGIAVLNDKGEIDVEKFKGRLVNLKKALNTKKITGNIGIGHTRWATHGKPNDINAHPHFNAAKTICVVHNGIIENYIEIKNFLISKGYKFVSETDTEVIPHLIEYYYQGKETIEDAVRECCNHLKGSFALGVISSFEKDKLIAVKKDSPLVVALGKHENFIASDITAVLNYTRNVYILEDNEMAIITKDSVELKNLNGDSVNKEIFRVNWDVDSAEKNGYPHFMLKEIYEQATSIRKTLQSTIKNNDIDLSNLNLNANYIKSLKNIYIVACGTAYHAGLTGKKVLENMIKVPVEVDIASEFRYRNAMINDKTLLIVVSQSGETADTIATLRYAKHYGAKVLAITNVVGSTISREADSVFYTLAGPEIAVASTKAYTTQITALYTIGLYLSKLCNIINMDEYNTIKKELFLIPEKIEKLLNSAAKECENIAELIYKDSDIFYLGRGYDYNTALEGALKNKEISYIHAEAYAAGELKHGTIALIDKGTKVISLLTCESLEDKTISNVKEVATRGAYIIGIAKEGNETVKDVCDKLITIPCTLDMLTPLLSVVPLQLIAYYTALKKGCDVDKPKNLAKSVTVE